MDIPALCRQITYMDKVRIEIRVTPEQAAAFSKAAAAKGLLRATWVKMVALEAVKKEK